MNKYLVCIEGAYSIEDKHSDKINTGSVLCKLDMFSELDIKQWITRGYHLNTLKDMIEEHLAIDKMHDSMPPPPQRTNRPYLEEMRKNYLKGCGDYDC